VRGEWRNTPFIFVFEDTNLLKQEFSGCFQSDQHFGGLFQLAFTLPSHFVPDRPHTCQLDISAIGPSAESKVYTEVLGQVGSSAVNFVLRIDPFLFVEKVDTYFSYFFFRVKIRENRHILVRSFKFEGACRKLTNCVKHRPLHILNLGLLLSDPHRVSAPDSFVEPSQSLVLAL